MRHDAVDQLRSRGMAKPHREHGKNSKKNRKPRKGGRGMRWSEKQKEGGDHECIAPQKGRTCG